MICSPSVPTAWRTKTTLATGDAFPAGRRPTARRRRAAPRLAPRRRASAFTLLEILLCLAVIGLVGGVVISGASHLIGDKPVTPDEVFWKATRAARKTALETEQAVDLSYDTKEKNFVITRADGTARTHHLVVSEGFEVDFLQIGRGDGLGLVLIAGELVETQKISRVMFYPDGTCTPFRVQFRPQNGSAWTIALDPWTCAEVLPPLKK